MSIDYHSIGQQIKKYRKQLGVTQAELAELCDIESPTVSNIERGTTKVSLPTLVKIANAVGATLDELVYGSLAKSEAVSSKELNEILADCSDRELRVIVEVAGFTKSALRKL